MNAVEAMAQVDALRSIVSDLQTLTLHDLQQFFVLHGDEPDVLDLLQVAFPELLRPYAQAAGLVTSQWYNELAPKSDYRAAAVNLDDVLPAARLASSVSWAFHAPTRQLVPDDFVPRDPVAVKQTVPLDVVQKRVAGSAKRMVADVSRHTVISNALLEDVQWARAAAPGACAFCRMLATRGAVYASKTTALKSHDHCACMAYPVRDGEWSPPSYVKQWKQEYKDARDAVGGTSPSMKEILSVMRRNDLDVEHLDVPV